MRPDAFPREQACAPATDVRVRGGTYLHSSLVFLVALAAFVAGLLVGILVVIA